MPRKQVSILVGLLGLLAVLVAVLADSLGIGAKEGTFGWKQAVLLGVGIALLIAAAVMTLRSPGSASETPPGEK
jgi:peptidoglycan/LPS O-acetylase OafA/YrhL